MKTVKFGIIGCGLMGREFASAAARWCHLTEMEIRPEIVAICNRTLSPEKINWYTDNFGSIKQVTSDYKELLANDEVEAVYIAVPHNLHQEFYCAAIKASKHVLGEKPFGIDLDAGKAILGSMESNPNCLVRCASQYIYYPAIQRILQMIEKDAFGRIIEVESGFSHSSDLNFKKQINWKRLIDTNGEYGCMGDLGFHIALINARANWLGVTVGSICSNIVTERPDATGAMVPCETWDNAVILTEAMDSKTGDKFPWTLRVHRIMPGEKNTLRISIYGTKASARFSLKNPKRLELLEYTSGEQAWQQIDMGFETAYPTITGGIFEFGSVDAFMQLMAAFMYELVHDKPLSFAGACPTPEEMYKCHQVFTAALESNRKNDVASLPK